MLGHARSISGLLALTLLLASCARGGARSSAPESDGFCLVTGDSGAASTVVVGVDGPLSWDNAPVPTTLTERIVFRQVFETLVEMDCEGRLQPGIAVGWQSGSGDSVWLFSLRSDLSYADGSPVTAGTVARDWVARGANTTLPASMTVDSLQPRVLRVRFDRPKPDAPRLVSSPAFAVVRREPGSPSPYGTTGFLPARGNDESIVLMRNDGLGITEIGYLRTPGSDMRDLLDNGVDFLVAERSDVVDYASTLPDYDVRGLPWDRTYLVALTGRGDSPGPLAPQPDLPDFRRALAADAIRDVARAHVPPGWWVMADCPVLARSSTAPRIGRIGLLAGDPTSRDIADRLVFLAGAEVHLPEVLTPLRRDLRMVAYASRSDMMSDSGAEPSALITWIGTSEPDVCDAIARLGLAEDVQVVPLVETRNHLVVRSNSPTLVVSGDGVPRVLARP